MVHIAPDYPDLKESTIHGLKIYLDEFKSKKQNSEELRVSTLPSAKIGWSLKLNAELDNQVKAYLLATCRGGGAVITDVAKAGAIRIICRKDTNASKKWGLDKRLGLKFIGPEVYWAL